MPYYKAQAKDIKQKNHDSRPPFIKAVAERRPIFFVCLPSPAKAGKRLLFFKFIFKAVGIASTGPLPQVK